MRAADRSDDDVLQLLPKARSQQASSRLARNQESDQATDLVAALDFQDLINIERATSQLEVLSALSEEQVAGLARFRNSVMHAVLEPAGDDTGRLEHLLTQTALVARLLGELEAPA